MYRTCSQLFSVAFVVVQLTILPSQGHILTEFPETELEKHVGQKITLKGTWGAPKLKWLIRDDHNHEVWIHQGMGPNAHITPRIDFPAEDADKTLDNRIGIRNFFKLGDHVVATGILYKFTAHAPDEELNKQIEAHPWTHYFFDERKVMVQKLVDK